MSPPSTTPHHGNGIGNTARHTPSAIRKIITNNKNMNYDEYGEVINGEDTYKGIAEELSKNAVLVWLD